MDKFYRQEYVYLKEILFMTPLNIPIQKSRFLSLRGIAVINHVLSTYTSHLFDINCSDEGLELKIDMTWKGSYKKISSVNKPIVKNDSRKQIVKCV